MNNLRLLLTRGSIQDPVRLAMICITFVRTHLHPLRLDPRLVAELDQSHQHGQAQPTNKNVEDSRHVAQTERARLVLSAQKGGVRGSQSWCY